MFWPKVLACGGCNGDRNRLSALRRCCGRGWLGVYLLSLRPCMCIVPFRWEEGVFLLCRQEVIPVGKRKPAGEQTVG